MTKETIRSSLKLLLVSALLLTSLFPTLCFAQDKLPIAWAFATSSTGSNGAFKSIDNNLSTYWQGGQGAGYWWIGFNLESSQPLSKISVSWDKDSGSTEYYILGSNDNINFTPLAGPFSSVGASINPQRKEHTISGTYRYVSIEIPKAQNNQYPIIYEVELYRGTNLVPRVVSLTPSSGSAPAETPLDFTTVYSDGNGYQDLRYGLLLINTSINGSNGFYGYCNPSTNKLYLRNDAGNKWLGGFAPGSANIIENSYASLDCSKTAVSGSGNTLSVSWNITFKPAFSGTKNCYLYTRDYSGAKTGWKQKGTWTIEGDTTAPVGIIRINDGDNYTGAVDVTLNLQAEDEEGGSGLDKMQFSNDNINWSASEGYADVKDWELFSGDGEKVVYVKYSDAAGNWSEVYQDSITLDTVPPQISSVAPEDGSFGVDGAVVSLYVGVDDNGLAPVEYQYSIDGQIVQPWLTVPFYHWNAQGKGIHTLKFEVRDFSGGDNREAEIYLAKEPIQPPN